MNPHFSKWLGPKATRTSLKTLLTFPFVLLTAIAVILIGFISFYNSGKSIDHMAGHLMDEISGRIQDRILRFLDDAHLINEINAKTYEYGQIAPGDMRKQELHFWKMIKSFEYISYTYIGHADGGFFGARRLASGKVQSIETKTLTGGEIRYIDTDDQGNLTKLSSIISQYDHKTRPWYKAAVKAEKPVWSDVFVDAGGEGLTITAAKPLYDKSGSVRGVLGCSFIFSHINQFLQKLKIGESGQAFIVERTGKLVATSTNDAVSTADKKRISAFDSENTKIRLTSHLISKRFGDYSRIDNKNRLSLDLEGERHFIQLTPLLDSHGINWVIVIAVPENDFMSFIKSGNRDAIMLSLTALLVTIIVGYSISRRITRPILELNAAARSLAEGDWSRQIDIHSRDEVGDLAVSFNIMARQLKDSIENLEQKVSERTAEIVEITKKQLASEKKYRELNENLRDGSVIVNLEGKIVEFNTSFQNLTGYTAEEIYSLNFHDITPARWHSMEQEILTEQVLKRGYSDPYVKECIKKNGTEFPVEISTYLVRDKDNNPSGFWSFVRDISDRKRVEEERERLISELQKALSEVKTLSGMLPICASCKKIRNDQGYWEQLEGYIRERSDAEFSHGICPECERKLYPELFEKE